MPQDFPLNRKAMIRAAGLFEPSPVEPSESLYSWKMIDDIDDGINRNMTSHSLKRLASQMGRDLDDRSDALKFLSELGPAMGHQKSKLPLDVQNRILNALYGLPSAIEPDDLLKEPELASSFLRQARFNLGRTFRDALSPRYPELDDVKDASKVLDKIKTMRIPSKEIKKALAEAGYTGDNYNRIRGAMLSLSEIPKLKKDAPHLQKGSKGLRAWVLQKAAFEGAQGREGSARSIERLLNRTNPQVFDRMDESPKKDPFERGKAVTNLDEQFIEELDEFVGTEVASDRHIRIKGDYIRYAPGARDELAQSGGRVGELLADLEVPSKSSKSLVELKRLGYDEDAIRQILSNSSFVEPVPPSAVDLIKNPPTQGLRPTTLQAIRAQKLSADSALFRKNARSVSGIAPRWAPWSVRNQTVAVPGTYGAAADVGKTFRPVSKAAKIIAKIIL